MRIQPLPKEIARARILIPDASAAELGSIAVDRFSLPLGQEKGQSLGLTALHDTVFLLASIGGTAQEVAEILHGAEDEVTNARDEINDDFSVERMAASVYQGIGQRFIPLHNITVYNRDLSPKEMKILNGFMAGKSNSDIARDINMSKKAAYLHFRRLWRNIGAGGRTHTSRRAFELSIFQIPFPEILEPKVDLNNLGQIHSRT